MSSERKKQKQTKTKTNKNKNKTEQEKTCILLLHGIFFSSFQKVGAGGRGQHRVRYSNFDWSATRGCASAAQDPYPCLGVIFSKKGTRYLGIFFPKIVHSLRFCHKNTLNFQNLANPGNLENHPMAKDFFMKMGPMSRDFLQKTNTFWWHIPVCLNM